MKTITTYITEKASFLVKKHINDKTFESHSDIDVGDFFYRKSKHYDSEYIDYCVKIEKENNSTILYCLELSIDKSIDYPISGVQASKETSDGFYKVSNVPDKYNDIVDAFRDFVESANLNKVTKESYIHGFVCASYNKKTHTIESKL